MVPNLKKRSPHVQRSHAGFERELFSSEGKLQRLIQLSIVVKCTLILFHSSIPKILF